jgi:ABC-type Fe3+ transport system permease subunit
MRLFTRKSKWDRLMDAAAATLARSGARRLTKITLGVVGGAVAATAASAAVSSVRRQDEQ